MLALEIPFCRDRASARTALTTMEGHHWALAAAGAVAATVVSSCVVLRTAGPHPVPAEDEARPTGPAAHCPTSPPEHIPSAPTESNHHAGGPHSTNTSHGSGFRITHRGILPGLMRWTVRSADCITARGSSVTLGPLSNNVTLGASDVSTRPSNAHPRSLHRAHRRCVHRLGCAARGGHAHGCRGVGSMAWTVDLRLQSTNFKTCTSQHCLGLAHPGYRVHRGWRGRPPRPGHQHSYNTHHMFCLGSV